MTPEFALYLARSIRRPRLSRRVLLLMSTPIRDAHPGPAFHPKKAIHEAFVAIVAVLYRLKPGSPWAAQCGCECQAPLIERPSAPRQINQACLIHSVHPGVMARRLGLA